MKLKVYSIGACPRQTPLRQVGLKVGAEEADFWSGLNTVLVPDNLQQDIGTWSFQGYPGPEAGGRSRTLFALDAPGGSFLH